VSKIYTLSINDGLGRSTDIGAFTSMVKLQVYKDENPIGAYESYEINEFIFIE